MSTWQQRDRVRARPSRREIGCVRKSHGESAARRTRVSEHVLRRHVEPRLPDRLPAVQRSATTSSASACSCRRATGRRERLARRGRRSARSSRRRRSAISTSSPSPCRSSGTTRTSCRSCGWRAFRCAPRIGTTAHPLVVMGGAVTFLNPEPLAPFADVIAVGEGEVLIPELVRRLIGAGGARRDLLARLAAGPGLLRARRCRGPLRRRRDARPGSPLRATSARRSRSRKAALPVARARRPAGDDDLHAGHRVRVAPAHRGRPRLRQPVPLLLGRLQLPARPRLSRRPDPAPGRAARARTPRGSASCRLRCAITRTSMRILVRPRSRWAIASARRRFGSTT